MSATVWECDYMRWNTPIVYYLIRNMVFSNFSHLRCGPKRPRKPCVFFLRAIRVATSIDVARDWAKFICKLASHRPLNYDSIESHNSLNGFSLNFSFWNSIIDFPKCSILLRCGSTHLRLCAPDKNASWRKQWRRTKTEIDIVCVQM